MCTVRLARGSMLCASTCLVDLYRLVSTQKQSYTASLQTKMHQSLGLLEQTRMLSDLYWH